MDDPTCYIIDSVVYSYEEFRRGMYVQYPAEGNEQGHWYKLGTVWVWVRKRQHEPA